MNLDCRRYSTLQLPFEFGQFKQPVNCLGGTNFTLKSLVNNDEFEVKDALVVSQFLDDESTLPLAVDANSLSHFKGVRVPVIHNRKCMDILIAQSDRALLAVLKELKELRTSLA